MIQYFGDFNFLFATPVFAIAPFVIPAAGLALRGISALFNRESKETKAQKRQLTALTKVQTGVAEDRGRRETELFRQSQPILAQVTEQLQALLGGDRQALTQRFGPQLEQLTKQRTGAEQRIQESGPAGGGTVQSLLELEKANFAGRGNLFAGAPAEAQAGLTQLLNLLLGASGAQGAGADRAAGIAGAGIESSIAASQRTRALNASLLESLAGDAELLGAQFAKPEDSTTTIDPTKPRTT